MEVDEEFGQDLEFLKEKSMWTIEESKQLLDEVDEKNIYHDVILFNNVKEKVNVCLLLKTTLKTALKEYNDTKSLKKYITTLKNLENVDFKREI